MQWSGSATMTQAVGAHRGEVTCLDAVGARAVSGSGDRALRLWRWEAGAGWQLVAEARAAHRYGVTAVRWSLGGALLASGGVDGAVRVWCGSGGSLGARRQLAAPGAAAARALTWAGGGGSRLLASHDDGAVCVWAVARGALLVRFAAHEGALHALATLAADSLLLTACTDGVLKVFDLAAVCSNSEASSDGGGTPTPLQWVDAAHDLGALCAAADEEGMAVATGGHDARIRVWRVSLTPHAVLEDVGALEGHTAAVTALRWAGTGSDSILASASLDRTARLWAPATAACLQVVAAHPRYLTCVLLAPDLRYMLTGSNDKTFRMWSLGSFSLDDVLDPPCEALAHFALGDLEGIGPVEEEHTECDGDATLDAEGLDGVEGGEQERGSGASRVWSAHAHAGAINCITTCDDLIATASSDGTVKVWRWEEATSAALEVHALAGHCYPLLAVEFGAGGAVLVAAGLDGRASVWDVASGVALRAVTAPGGGGTRGGEAGGGGVRAARLSPHRPPLLLLATDDGLAALWGLTDPDPHPTHVYAGHTEAVTCCAWSSDGRVAATGAASGELRLLAPPRPTALHHDSHAHDLGVLSCDFAPTSDCIELPEGSYLLATAGCDSLVKLWRIDLEEETGTALVVLARQVSAHGGAVACLRWGVGGSGEALLATAGADRWARVWRVTLGGGEVRAEATAAAPARGAGGALAVALACGGTLLAVGTLAGELALWRLHGTSTALDDDDGAAPLFWGEAGVTRWLRDYIVYAPGSTMSSEQAAALELRVRSAGVSGARLLHDDVDDLLRVFGFDDESICTESDGVAEKTAVEQRERLRDELDWLRAAPTPREIEKEAPHSLLCPLSHRMLREPARAADGFSYERANLREWLLAAPPEGAASPISGGRLRSTRVAPNYALRDTLRAFLRDAAAARTVAADSSDTPE